MIAMVRIVVIVKVPSPSNHQTKETTMTMPTNENNDFPANLLELDLPAPAATTDDDDIAALVPDAAPVATVEPTVEPTIGDFTNTNTGPTAPAGSIRTDGFVAPTERGTDFDQSPLSDAELATLAANRARSVAHHNAVRNVVSVTAPAPVAVPEVIAEPAPIFSTGEVVETGLITDTRIGTIFSMGPTSVTGYSVPLAAVVTRCEGTGVKAPGLKTGKAQFGAVMRTFSAYQGNTLIARGVSRADTARLGLDWPENVASRYVLGYLDGSPDLGKLGDKLMVASLIETSFTVAKGKRTATYEIQFSGGSEDMRNRVIAKFAALNADCILTSTDLRNWYKDRMCDVFGAIEYGGLLLVLGTGDMCDRAKEFTRKIRANGFMGRNIAFVTQSNRESVDWQEFCEVMGSGLVSEVDALRERYALALKLAIARDVKELPETTTDEDRDLCSRRAMIKSGAANSLFQDLSKLTQKASGMSPAIGKANTAAAVAACEALRADYATRCEGIDQTSALAANIEMD